MSIDIVEMKPVHLSSVLTLVQAMDRQLHLDREWLRFRTLDDPTCPPDLLLVAKVEGELAGFCFACLRDGRGVIKLFGVQAQRRRQGVATALLDTVESRLRARDVEQVVVGGVAPNYFLPGVNLRNTEAIAYLVARGYQSDRVARVDMGVRLTPLDLDTGDSERRLAGEGIVLRRALSAEIQEVAQFALTHFSSEWRGEVADAARFAPPPLFIALDDGHVVAFAVYDVTGASRFGPTGTHPTYRRRGIGTVLLKMCLRSIRDRGERRAEIVWTGPIGYYARAVNARIQRAYWVFRKSLVGSAH